MGKLLEKVGMQNQGNAHWYDAKWLGGPTCTPIGRFINLVSKAHDFWNGWNYKHAGTMMGAYISRGVAFDAAFNVSSFSGMPLMGAYTAAALDPSATNLYRKSTHSSP